MGQVLNLVHLRDVTKLVHVGTQVHQYITGFKIVHMPHALNPVHLEISMNGAGSPPFKNVERNPLQVQ